MCESASENINTKICKNSIKRNDNSRFAITKYSKQNKHIKISREEKNLNKQIRKYKTKQNTKKQFNKYLKENVKR